MNDSDPKFGACCDRRAVLGAGLAMLPALATPGHAQEAGPAEKRPQPGDHLVFLTGPLEGKPIHVNDLELGGAQVQAYPADPSGLVRDGSRLNLLIVVRLGESGLSDETLPHAADGVLAFSGVCTHQACPVNMWSAELKSFVCSCHASTYDPRKDAEVIAGPAPRRLAALPLKSENGLLVVAGSFIGKVGGTTI